MSALLRLAALITAGNRAVFHGVAWLTGLMVLGYFLIAVLRYALGWGSVAMQESVMYLHATVFMLAAAAGLASDTHVRVDILHSRWSDRRKALADVAGSLLLLLPFALFILMASLDYVGRAWQLRETSSDAGGLAYVWLLKTLIPLMAVQLIAQSLAQAALALERWRRSRA